MRKKENILINGCSRGLGYDFLLKNIKEAKIFREAEIIDSTKPLGQICIN